MIQAKVYNIKYAEPKVIQICEMDKFGDEPILSLEIDQARRLVACVNIILNQIDKRDMMIVGYPGNINI